MEYTIHHKERLYFIFMSIISFILYGGFFLITKKMSTEYSGLIIIFLFLVIFHLIGSLLLVGRLRGNAVKISSSQFPDIYEILEFHSEKLGLKKLPDMYLLQGHGYLNAFALKFAQRNYVVIYSDVLELAYQEGKDAVSFIIGHELSHIKRNHTGFFKSIILLPAKFIPFLGKAYSRACEYTCDNMGYNLCPNGALKGILILAVGKKLHTRVDIGELISDTKSQSNFAVKLAEIFSSHPTLINRIRVLEQLNYDNSRKDSFLFISPKIKDNDIKKFEPNR